MGEVSSFRLILKFINLFRSLPDENKKKCYVVVSKVVRFYYVHFIPWINGVTIRLFECLSDKWKRVSLIETIRCRKTGFSAWRGSYHCHRLLAIFVSPNYGHRRVRCRKGSATQKLKTNVMGLSLIDKKISVCHWMPLNFNGMYVVLAIVKFQAPWQTRESRRNWYKHKIKFNSFSWDNNHKTSTWGVLQVIIINICT